MSTPAAVVISVLALAFTLFSFWWMNWRPARLRVGNVQHFAAGRATQGASDSPNVLVVGLPLIIFNSGATPSVLESLRLVPVGGNPLGTFLFKSVETPLWTQHHPIEIEADDFFLPTTIKPNEVIKQNFVFTTAPSTGSSFQRALYHFHLEAKLSWSRDWHKLKDIELDFRGFDDQMLYELNAFYRVYYSPSVRA